MNISYERKIPEPWDVYTPYDMSVNKELAMKNLRRIISAIHDTTDDTIKNNIKHFGTIDETEAGIYSEEINGQVEPTGTLAVNTSEHAKDRWPFVVTFEKPQ